MLRSCHALWFMKNSTRMYLSMITLLIRTALLIFIFKNKKQLALMNVFLCLCTKNIIRLPFDSKNPIGYSIALALECTMLLNPLRYLAVLVTLGFANYKFAKEIANDAIDYIHLFSECAKARRPQQKQQQYMIELLSHWVCIHSDAKELVNCVQ